MFSLDFIRTRWDLSVDTGSRNTGRQVYEKLIRYIDYKYQNSPLILPCCSGMYLGELTRHILLEAVTTGLLLPGTRDRAIEVLGTRYHH